MSLKDVIVVAIAIAIAVVVTDRCRQGDISEWEDRVAQAQQNHAADMARIAEVLEQESVRADSAEARAQELEAQEPVIRERIDSVRVQTPPELEDHPAITRRDSIIDTLIVQRDSWKDLFREEQAANVRLRGLLDDAVADADSLSAVLDDRPSERPWWLPRLGVGPFAGMCSSGRPCSGVGATLSWDIAI